ncbi:hypothetical protein SERLADRAFT_439971 [Serpula lacrymans var. lacrymans S7.9]|uniref:Cytochrome P450 n=1 Tax=Serpula lacrymans var. lacrymans (strain S7.9) TaxID=578457 RepID=F8P250_SERL9|nr:uncharacterized protein SERLADRAFT_439971 [Serpula lacrymans var. lacrymans S7.9]EGO23228.1 hypothetical protein SERLADRAFT_439971 [Serpula lacrymans var. lacrymans S7.9]
MFEVQNTRSVALVLSLFAIFGIAKYLVRKASNKNGHLRFPPGPPRLPIVGNALEATNSDKPWVTYKKWADVYGDIIYCRMLNQDVIIINSEKVAKDLLEKRSSNYSDRPFLNTTEIFGFMFNVLFLRYGDKWRQHRRLLHDKLRTATALSYRPSQMHKTHQLLIDMLETPENFAYHLQAMMISTIMCLTYGYETARWRDPLVATIEEAIGNAHEVTTPEASAVLDALPLLLHIPSWFPGAGFKRRARRSREMFSDMVEKPFQYTKSHMYSDKAVKCIVSDLLATIKDEDNHDEFEKVIKSVASTLVVGGSETTMSTLLDFVLAMILFPDVQKRAQTEIDSVVGSDRLPNFDDRSSLPYVEAVLRESHRWHPVAPLGVAHAAVDDDIYEGYRIPKGLAAHLAMSQNEAKYPNPSEFMPERFFTADGKLNDDMIHYAFGFGRRACPGQHVANAGVWAAIVSLLAIFKFTKAKDDQGKGIGIEPQWTTGIAM